MDIFFINDCEQTEEQEKAYELYLQIMQAYGPDELEEEHE